MTTITERIEYASAAAHDCAAAAIEDVRELLGLRVPTIADYEIAKHHPVLLAALIEAAAKVYAAERQYEAAERIADGLMEIADAITRTKS